MPYYRNVQPTTLNTIKWWELRRIPYTIVVAAAGVLSYFISNSITSMYAQRGEEFLNPSSLLIGVPAAVLIANVFYTFGWVVDLVKQGNRQPNKPSSVVLFYSGLAFSVCLMFAPAGIAFLTWLRS